MDVVNVKAAAIRCNLERTVVAPMLFYVSDVVIMGALETAIKTMCCQLIITQMINIWYVAENGHQFAS